VDRPLFASDGNAKRMQSRGDSGQVEAPRRDRPGGVAHMRFQSSFPECRARFFKSPAEADGGDATRKAALVVGFDRKAT
jgi:hypothetical protein